MRTRSLSIALGLLVLAFTTAFSAAQTVSFAGAQTTVPATGLNTPVGVVVDGAGNLFISDYGAGRIVEMPAGGGAQTTVPASGLIYPWGIALDGAGDLFIGDLGLHQVVELPAGGGAQTTVGSGLVDPFGVAVDGAGDVFIADPGIVDVVEVPAGGSGQTALVTGLNAYGVAVDGAGDVFIADVGTGSVLEVPTGGGPQTTVPTSGLLYPYGVAVDGAGDLFIVDRGNNQVVEVPAGGGPQTVVPASGLSSPFGVGADAAGNVFIADSGNGRVLEIQRVAVNFGTANVCAAEQTTPAPCNQTLTLNYNITAPTTFGAIKIATQGTPNLDFTLSSSTCTGSVPSGSACIVVVTFAPLAPGVRAGAVQLTDNSGTVLVSTIVHGIGQGPAIAFGPGVQTTVPASGLGQVLGVAVDAAGNVFIADTYNARVVEVPAGGGPQATVGSGLCAPTGVAVDGAGDVFIADYCNFHVVEVPAGGGPQTIVPTSGLSRPHGVAVDGAGDVFITDFLNNRVLEVTPGGVQTTVPASGLNEPVAVAVDGAGDVFIADAANNRVVEVTPSGVQTTIGSGLAFPSGVAVDAAGDVFIGDYSNGREVEVTPSGVQTTLPISGLSNPFGVAVDGAGDVFIADRINNRVVELQRSQPPALSFASTAVGNTSTDSPQSVTAQNVGNQSLTAVPPGLSIGQSFVQVAGSGTPADCTANFSLVPGASCNLSVSFTPQTAGNLLSSATFVDNALNAPSNSTSAAQSVALQGTATQDNQSITFGALSNQSLGTAPFAVSATASSTLAVSFTSTTSAVCTVSTATVTLVTAGTCTIQATQAGNATYFAATPVNQSFQISDFALTSNSPITVTAGQPATFTLTTTPQGTYASAITLSCGTLPAMATCTFTPSATVTPNATTVTTTLTITTAAHTSAAALGTGPRSNSLYAVWLLLPALLLGTAAKASPKGRKLLTFALMFLLLGGCLFQSACGGSGPNLTTGTPAGTYSVIVTGAAGSDQHTTTVMLTVK